MRMIKHMGAMEMSLYLYPRIIPIHNLAPEVTFCLLYLKIISSLDYSHYLALIPTSISSPPLYVHFTNRSPGLLPNADWPPEATPVHPCQLFADRRRRCLSRRQR